MSRVRSSKPNKPKRLPSRGRAVPDDLPVLLERIDASAFMVAEVDAIERLMFDVIETLMARGTARQSAPGDGAALLARRLRDSNR